MTKKTSQKILSLFLDLFQFGLGYASTVLTILCVLNGFEIPYRTSILLWGIGIFYIFVFFWLSQKKTLKQSFQNYPSIIFFILFILTVAVFFLIFRTEITTGFVAFKKEVYHIFLKYYEDVFHFRISKNQALPVSYAFVLCSIPISFVINFILRKDGPRILFVIISILPVCSPFLVGLTGSEKVLMLYIAYAITILGSKARKSPEVRKKIQFIMFALTTFCMLIMIRIFPSDYYESIDSEKIKQSVQETFNDFEDRFYQSFFYDQDDSAIFTGGLNYGEFGWVDEVHYLNKDAVTVTISETVREQSAFSLYLRSYIGEKYESNHFTTLDQAACLEKDDLDKRYDYDLGELNSNYLSQFGLHGLENNINIANIKVQNIWEGPDYYIPYFCTDEVEEGRDGKLQYEKSTDQKEYSTFYYYRGIDTIQESLPISNNKKDTFATEKISKSLPEEKSDYVYDRAAIFQTVESDYRAYVKKYDLSIPVGLSEKTVALFSGFARSRAIEFHDLTNNKEHLFQYGSYGTIIDESYLNYCINTIKSYLASNTKYSLTPGAVPEGRDLIDYFLFENKKGFCAYYAATATLAFRAMGIPARYVEGFKASKQDILNATKVGEHEISFTLKDANAHAWVEIYIDGFGWYPVDVTPGYEDGNAGQMMGGDVSGTNQTSKPTSTDEPKESETPADSEESLNYSDTPENSGYDSSYKEDFSAQIRPDKNDPTVLNHNQSVASSSHKKVGTLILWIIIIFLLGVVVFLIIYYSTSSQRLMKRAYAQNNCSRTAQILYSVAEKNILKLKGNSEYKSLHQLYESNQNEDLCRIIEIGEKAAFSDTELSTEELDDFCGAFIRYLFQETRTGEKSNRS